MSAKIRKGSRNLLVRGKPTKNQVAHTKSGNFEEGWEIVSEASQNFSPNRSSVVHGDKKMLVLTFTEGPYSGHKYVCLSFYILHP
jgi:hypothetical protein